MLCLQKDGMVDQELAGEGDLGDSCCYKVVLSTCGWLGLLPQMPDLLDLTSLDGYLERKKTFGTIK